MILLIQIKIIIKKLPYLDDLKQLMDFIMLLSVCRANRDNKCLDMLDNK